MRILIDISHPAHVHFFKNAIAELRARGHVIGIASREKDICTKLLNTLGLDHTPLSTAPAKKSIMAFTSEMAVHCFRLFNLARSFRPDVMLQIAGTFIAPVGKLIRCPTIGFYDTEFAKLSNAISYPLLTNICTPNCYQGDIGPHQIRYPGYHELAYLHPDNFTPDEGVLAEYGLEKRKKYFIVRFVGFNALHDYHETGFNLAAKHRLVEALSKLGRVLITSESPLPAELSPYRSPVPIDKIHDLMAFATLLVSESSTMASESAVLGIPALFISSTGRGYTDEQEANYGLVRNFKPEQHEACLNTALEIAGKPLDGVRAEYQEKRARLLRHNVNTTEWMIDFVESIDRKKGREPTGHHR